MNVSEPIQNAALLESDILIVEDDPGICDAMKCLFEEVSIKASFAETGEEALANLQYRSTPPSLIVLDGRLPDARGLFLATQIRDLVPARTSVYLFSADPRQSFGTEAQLTQAGITGFISKPFDIEVLIKLALQHSTDLTLSQ